MTIDPSWTGSAEILRSLDAKSLRPVERVQSLWSGYGAIWRCKVEGGSQDTVIVKSVEPPTAANHPRGWATNASHERKLRSYDVELAFYQEYARRTGERCRVPQGLHLEESPGRWLFVLEDLDAAGFSERRASLNDAEMGACLGWLATFHAAFLGIVPDRLWPTGTYWHLETRPDELAVMTEVRLKEAASELDRRLSAARFQTLVHGDAKVANFCFRQRGDQQAGVAAVDFQYVGGGCGMKDFAYFLSSCLDESECEAQAEHWMDVYFSHLRVALSAHQPDVVVEEVEHEWRELYPAAWADFVRFLVGWAPEHYKIHGYSRRMTELAIRQL